MRKLAEKGMIVYDQQTWNVGGDWIDLRRLARQLDLLYRIGRKGWKWF